MSVLVSKHYATKTVRGSIDVAEEVCNYSQKYQESPKIKAYLGQLQDFTECLTMRGSLDTPRNADHEAMTLDSPLVRKSHDSLAKGKQESKHYYEELRKPELPRKQRKQWNGQKHTTPLLKMQDSKRKIVLFQKIMEKR